MTAKVHILTCGNCGVEFQASPTQLKRSRSKRNTGKRCCSKACAYAAMAESKRKDIPEHGPCPTCGKMFKSRTSKEFCSMNCYVKSDKLRQHCLDNAKVGLSASVLAKTGRELQENIKGQCIECGEELLSIPSQIRRFCSRDHYRAYMAKRFDRWIASPQAIALPQNYDEFLQQEELPCLIEGCDWIGHGLTLHMNFAHGIEKDEFKRASGFNLTTGVVSRPMHLAMVGTEYRKDNMEVAIEANPCTTPPPRSSYRSREAIEHATKSRHLRRLTTEPNTRVCNGCGTKYKDKDCYVFSKFCTIECREEHYKRLKAAITCEATCGNCHEKFHGSYEQKLRINKGLTVYCNIHCRQSANSRQRAITLKKRKLSCATA